MEALIIGIVVFLILRAIIGGGKSKERYAVLPNFEVRLIDDIVQGDSSQSGDLSFKKIEIRGLLPVTQTTDLTAVTTALDVTDDKKPMPVISYIDAFWEPDSTVFMNVCRIGKAEENSGFKDWVEVGRIFPSFLQTPKTGKRKIAIQFFLVDSDNPPAIRRGFLTGSDSSGLKSHKELIFEHEFLEKGYIEASEDVNEARGIAVKIAMAVAMADGSLDDREGVVIKEWIERAIAAFSNDKQNHLKKLYNAAMKSAFSEAQKGELSLSDLTEKLNKLNERKIKYDAIELCYEVMAADGVADVEELKTIRMVGKALYLDMEELEKMRDQKLLGLSTSATTQASIEEIVGIEKDWDKTKIKSHLTSEFQKWNNRLNALPEGDERANAQLMLDKIAEARKKYAV